MDFGLALSNREDLGTNYSRLYVDRQTSEMLVRQFDRWILLYRATRRLPPLFVGRAIVAGLSVTDNPDWRHCILSRTEQFIVPVEGDLERGAPGLRRFLKLDADRFQEIVARGGTIAASEPVADYEPKVSSAEAYQKIYRQVLKQWGYRCALTGSLFAPAEGLHPDLSVVPIRPISAGGDLHAANFLPIMSALRSAWMTGLVGVAENGVLLLSLSEGNEPVAALLKGTGRLAPPAVLPVPPDRANLRWHRENVFGVSQPVPPSGG